MDVIGCTRWAIPEGYIPSESSYSERALVSHETASILNAGDRDAHIALTIYFSNRDSVGPYRIVVPARRTLHLRFNDLKDPQPIPRDTIMRRYSSRMYRSSCNTHDSIPGAPKSRSCRRLPMPKAERRRREISNLRERQFTRIIRGCLAHASYRLRRIVIVKAVSH